MWSKRNFIVSCHFSILCFSFEQLSVMKGDCTFTGQGLHVPGVGGPKNKIPAPFVYFIKEFFP